MESVLEQRQHGDLSLGDRSIRYLKKRKVWVPLACLFLVYPGCRVCEKIFARDKVTEEEVSYFDSNDDCDPRTLGPVRGKLPENTHVLLLDIDGKDSLCAEVRYQGKKIYIPAYQLRNCETRSERWFREKGFLIEKHPANPCPD